MYTDLSFLDIGKKFLPDDHEFKCRLKNYQQGRMLYEGEFEEVFQETWQAIASRYGLTYKDVEQVMINLNLFKATTETFKLLAFMKEPELEDDSLKDKINFKKFINTMKKSFISGHAQGNGIFKVYSKSDGTYDISSVNPELWIPVYDPENLEEIQYHVIYNIIVEKVIEWGKQEENKKLYVEIHRKGGYEKRLYTLKRNGTIDKLIEQTDVTFDNWAYFVVFAFDYGTPNWRSHGVSAYNDLISIVDEIVVRISNNSKILDDHADPQLIVPDSSLEFDANSGQHIYKRHQALKIDKDGNKPSYLTWDGNIDHSMKQLEKAMDFFYMISGTNPQMYGKDIAGNLSGDALAKILLVPINKTKEMIGALEDAAENALECIVTLQNETASNYSIQFEIGALNDLTDISNRTVNEKNAGIRSVQSAVEKINPNYDEDKINEESNRILEQESVGNLTDFNSNVTQ